MDKHSDDKNVVEQKTEEHQPQESWRQRHFPELLAGGMLLLIVLLILLQSRTSE